MPRIGRKYALLCAIIGGALAAVFLLLVLGALAGARPGVTTIAVADQISNALSANQDGTAAAGNPIGSQSAGQVVVVDQPQKSDTSADVGLECTSCAALGYGTCSPNAGCAQPASNPYAAYSCQCTSYAWEQAAQAGYLLPHWGNACSWSAGAASCGYTVRDTPAPKSIAVHRREIYDAIQREKKAKDGAPADQGDPAKEEPTKEESKAD